jgi:hypothetical protein
VQKDIANLNKKIQEVTGIKETDTGLSQPSNWDLVADKQMMQEEQPLQVARCTKIINPNTDNAKCGPRPAAPSDAPRRDASARARRAGTLSYLPPTSQVRDQREADRQVCRRAGRCAPAVYLYPRRPRRPPRRTGALHAPSCLKSPRCPLPQTAWLACYAMLCYAMLCYAMLCYAQTAWRPPTSRRACAWAWTATSTSVTSSNLSCVASMHHLGGRRYRYQIQIPLPPKIDPAVTMIA